MSTPQILVPEPYAIAEIGNGSATKESLRDPDAGMRWGTTTMSDIYVVIDRGVNSPPACAGVGLYHTPATATATRLLRSSDTLANLQGSSPPGPFARRIPAAGTDDFIANAGNSEAAASFKHWRYRSTTWIDTASPITERYVRLDVTDPALSAFAASRLVAGTVLTLSKYPKAGAQPPHFLERTSRRVSLAAGRTGGRSFRGRVARFAIDTDEAESMTLQRIFERRGTGLDVVLVWDYAATLAHRLTMLALMSEPIQPTVPLLSAHDVVFGFEESFDPIGHGLEPTASGIADIGGTILTDIEQ